MGSFSASTYRGLVPWQELLLAVSLLNFWCLPTAAQLAIVSTYAAEGENVHLYVRNMPPDAIRFEWFRGEGEKPHHKIATHYIVKGQHDRDFLLDTQQRVQLKEFLTLRKVTIWDSGMYTVVAHLQNSKKEIGFGRLTVYEPVILVGVLASNTTVREDKDSVVFTCYSNAFSPKWLFNGMTLCLGERMKLSQDHRSLTIDPVKREDAGNYQCQVSNPINSEESWPVGLDVIYD